MFERVSVVDGCWWCWGKKTEVGAGGGKGFVLRSEISCDPYALVNRNVQKSQGWGCENT